MGTQENFLDLYLKIHSHADDAIIPIQTLFNWSMSAKSLTTGETDTATISLAPGQEQLLFSGLVSISSDATTTWDISQVAGTIDQYKLSHNSGTAPVFRTQRTINHDATTEVTVTQNGSSLVFTATGGTIWDLSSVQVGDTVSIGPVFNVSNRGLYTIIAVTATSFTIANVIGTPEGPIILGASYASEIDIFSSTGVQVGDKAVLKENFSLTSHGTYEIIDVRPDYLVFRSINVLPSETAVSNSPESVQVFNSSKKFVFFQSDQRLSFFLNGSTEKQILEPMYCGSTKKYGIYLSTAEIKELKLLNDVSGSDTKVTYFLAE